MNHVSGKAWEQVLLQSLRSLDSRIHHLNQNICHLNTSLDKMSTRVGHLEAQQSYWRGAGGMLVMALGFLSTVANIGYNILGRG